RLEEMVSKHVVPGRPLIVTSRQRVFMTSSLSGALDARGSTMTATPAPAGDVNVVTSAPRASVSSCTVHADGCSTLKPPRSVRYVVQPSLVAAEAPSMTSKNAHAASKNAHAVFVSAKQFSPSVFEKWFSHHV